MMHLHRPQDRDDSERIGSRSHPAQYRFAVEELTAHRLALLERRKKIRAQKNPAIKTGGSSLEVLKQALPFELTGAQQRVVAELMQDLPTGAVAPDAGGKACRS